MLTPEKLADFRLCTPWNEYHEQVKALFGQDPEIKIEYDDKRKTLTLRVESQRKAAALSRLLPLAVRFGGVEVRVCVVPANAAGKTLPDDAATADVLLAAFNGNPAVTQVRQVSKGLFRDLCYCVFKKEVVQYPADNLGDINGNRSVLMEDIAREVLAEAKGVCFCTSAGREDANGFGDAPLGEWP
ncbi:MAG: hypothetical protein II649_04505 [Kiritimatiellae bacterium]|nr:hypothetical protein [Kiritimatiellia bacterium]